MGGVEKEYKDYLLYERSDAFLVGLLSYAMRTKQDIWCEAPVSEELLNNLKNHLLPLLVKYTPEFYNCNIIAAIAKEKLNICGEHIGTSGSCGVDCLHTIANYYQSEYPDMNLTSLSLNDVGAYNEIYGDDNEQGLVRDYRYGKAKELAEELGLNVILTFSNFYKAFPQNHFFTQSFSSALSILCLRKYWKIFYYSSSGELANFSVRNIANQPSSLYEYVLWNCISTDGLKVYSEGCEKNRIEKVEKIADFKYTDKYLHVCKNEKENCGKCEKCVRTLICADIAGKLEKFSNVFDIDDYVKNRKMYYDKYLSSYALNHRNSYVYEGICGNSDFHDLMDDYENVREAIKDKKIILYGIGSLGKEILKCYGTQVKMIIDNKVKGKEIIDYSTCIEKYERFDESYVCVISSVTYFEKISQTVKKAYPSLEILPAHILVFKKEERKNSNMPQEKRDNGS